jgi:hypothetical protein
MQILVDPATSIIAGEYFYYAKSVVKCADAPNELFYFAYQP